jgi:hypothetical protein
LKKKENKKKRFSNFKKKAVDYNLEMRRIIELPKPEHKSDRINTDSAKLRQDHKNEKASKAEEEKQKYNIYYI